LTTLLHYTLSRPRWNFFEAQPADAREIFPVLISFCLQVVLSNCSLAVSFVTFYHIARILLTPFVALINYFAYHKSIPRMAAYTLVPTCVGVSIVSYYESMPQDGTVAKKTSFLGVFFAFTGTLASSVYIVWIKVYHERLQMNSMQLPFNQAPYGAMIVLYLVPFANTFPDWPGVPLGKWAMILMVSIFCRLCFMQTL